MLSKAYHSSSSLFIEIGKLVEKEQPHWIIAQGDTNSVFVTSVVAFYHKVKFAHMEAGLRTGNKFSPFPEEFNRKTAGYLADIHFAPTQHAVTTLLAEGVCSSKIIHTGNTVIDALLNLAKKPKDSTSFPFELPRDKKIILVTAHRRENFESMNDMFEALVSIADTYKDVYLIYPLHLNPVVHNKAQKILKNRPNIALIPPLGYCDFVYLMKQSSLILTDSGGVQEEAPTFGIPLLVMRDNTERPEGIKAGVATLVGTKPESILSAFEKHYRNNFQRHNIPNPYGDGKAAQRIADFFLSQNLS